METRTPRQQALISRWRADAERQTAAKRARLAAARLPENQPSQQTRVRVLDLMGAEYVLPTDWSPDQVEGFASSHKVVVQVPNRPSLVRRGERPHVEHAISRPSLAALAAEYAALPAKMRGKKGKQRQLMKRKQDRLARALAAFVFIDTRQPRAWTEPPTFPPAPVSSRPITQAEYYGAPFRPATRVYGPCPCGFVECAYHVSEEV